MATPDFKRILVALHHGAPSPTMGLAAEVAALLRLDLLGLFVQEEGLIELAALPFAREFRPLGGWRSIEPDRLSEELELAARGAERRFAQAVKGLDTACRFEVVKGSIADSIASMSSGGDIVMISQPAHPAEHATRQFASLLAAAARSSAVMLVPKQVARKSGAVVAVASHPGDPSIETAASIAAAAREQTIVLAAYRGAGEGRSAGARSNAADGMRRVPVAHEQLSEGAGITSAFQQLNERLVVMTRGFFAESVPFRIASLRRDPVLIVKD
jgi:hypothetical protein